MYLNLSKNSHRCESQYNHIERPYICGVNIHIRYKYFIKEQQEEGKKQKFKSIVAQYLLEILYFHCSKVVGKKLPSNVASKIKFETPVFK
ncbi:MAG: hypothetical protein IPL25_19525 [Saprospiraceae bacterium]|nr:hypothetical protein [Candidatus Vicinibacter affinis]